MFWNNKATEARVLMVLLHDGEYLSFSEDGATAIWVEVVSNALAADPIRTLEVRGKDGKAIASFRGERVIGWHVGR